MVIAVHGGAGRRPRDRPVDADGSRADLAQAVDAGWVVLDRGGSALDAAQAAVVSLEDCPRYNAGRGAVLNAHGEPELDAAVMDGATRRAGAVAGGGDRAARVGVGAGPDQRRVADAARRLVAGAAG